MLCSATPIVLRELDRCANFLKKIWAVCSDIALPLEWEDGRLPATRTFQRTDPALCFLWAYKIFAFH